MNKKRVLQALAALLIVLLLANSVLAMSSGNYRLDWFTPLTGTGGPSASANYAVNLTVGQSATGVASSTSYTEGLGYWYGIIWGWLTRLPVVFKN